MSGYHWSMFTMGGPLGRVNLLDRALSMAADIAATRRDWNEAIGDMPDLGTDGVATRKDGA